MLYISVLPIYILNKGNKIHFPALRYVSLTEKHCNLCRFNESVLQKYSSSLLHLAINTKDTSKFDHFMEIKFLQKRWGNQFENILEKKRLQNNSDLIHCCYYLLCCLHIRNILVEQFLAKDDIFDVHRGFSVMESSFPRGLSYFVCEAFLVILFQLWIWAETSLKYQIQKYIHTVVLCEVKNREPVSAKSNYGHILFTTLSSNGSSTYWSSSMQILTHKLSPKIKSNRSWKASGDVNHSLQRLLMIRKSSNSLV